ncbi:hypothetical protein G6F68_012327 [Rhizopus microsporus]|nr:hypothetical protein G6F68_012327 [Rhizopus microsporus]
MGACAPLLTALSYKSAHVLSIVVRAQCGGGRATTGSGAWVAHRGHARVLHRDKESGRASGPPVVATSACFGNIDRASTLYHRRVPAAFQEDPSHHAQSNRGCRRRRRGFDQDRVPRTQPRAERARADARTRAGGSGAAGLQAQPVGAQPGRPALSGMLEACHAQHYNLILGPVGTGRRTLPDLAALFENSRPDGVVLIPPLTDDEVVLSYLEEQDIPFACIAPRHPEGRIGVRMDETTAVVELIGHLVAQGHRRIGHIKGPRAHGACQWRHAGYRQALRGAGIACAPQRVVDG